MTAYIDRKKSAWTEEALRTAEDKIFWTDDPAAPQPDPPLQGDITADLVIVGAGFTGLWAALQAKEENPDSHIVVLEARCAGFGASSRNGGFCMASLTHGLHNGIQRWPGEMPDLLRMGQDNLQGILDTVEKYHIQADFEINGMLHIATAPWQVAQLKESIKTYRKYGQKVTFLDQKQVQDEVKSPVFLAGCKVEDRTIMINPSKLVWGLKAVCEKLGVGFFENTEVQQVKDQGEHLLITTGKGSVRAKKALIGTNAWSSVVKSMRKYIIPVYDHVLVTGPLTAAQMASVGWKGREGLGDNGNQFHYYRLTADNRILWGGWDANYYRYNAMGRQYEQIPDSYYLLSDHFFETFPQLENQVRFTHRWAGPIGTTSQFSATFGKKYRNKLAWVGGYTGLGVGASRFGARVALDLLYGKDTPATRLKMVRKKPVPFPPDPLRYYLIQHTKKSIARADANQGRRGFWLRMLDRLGLGFNS